MHWRCLRRLLAAALASLTVALPGAVLGKDPPSMSEKEATVRAAFLYRLAFFVNWDDSSFARADSPLRFCVVAEPASQVAPLLSEHTAERKVGPRAIEVEQRQRGASFDGCHLLYLEHAADAPREHAPGQLVVVDSLDGLQHGAALALVAEADSGQQKRLGFVAHRDRLPNRGVTLSARLLQLVRFLDEGSGR